MVLKYKYKTVSKWFNNMRKSVIFVNMLKHYLIRHCQNGKLMIDLMEWKEWIRDTRILDCQNGSVYKLRWEGYIENLFFYMYFLSSLFCHCWLECFHTFFQLMQNKKWIKKLTYTPEYDSLIPWHWWLLDAIFPFLQPKGDWIYRKGRQTVLWKRNKEHDCNNGIEKTTWCVSL